MSAGVHAAQGLWVFRQGNRHPVRDSGTRCGSTSHPSCAPVRAGRPRRPQLGKAPFLAGETADSIRARMNTPSDFEAQAAAWLVRREAPNFSAAGQAEFEAWANADPRHRAAFVRLEAAWRRADRLRGLKPLDGTVDEDLLARSPFTRLEEYSASAGTKDSRVEPAAAALEVPAEESPLEKSAIRRFAADGFS